MPQMANITVKKNDGTTDIVYTALTPSAGDKVAAQWRSNSVGSANAHRPTYSMSSHSNANQTQRVVKTNYVYPIVQTDANSVSRVAGFITRVTETKIILSAPDADVNEAVSQSIALENSALVKDSTKMGYSPT